MADRRTQVFIQVEISIEPRWTSDHYHEVIEVDPAELEGLDGDARADALAQIAEDYVTDECPVGLAGNPAGTGGDMTAQQQEQPAPDPVPVTVRITTYYKQPRNASGVITQESSNRLALSEAIDWILADLPEAAVTVTPNSDTNGDITTLRIDWSKVPTEIRYPFEHGVKRRPGR